MTKGQIEARISEEVSRFESEYMGRGPQKIRTTIVRDMIIIRLIGFLSPSERNLADDPPGIELLKKLRTSLFEKSKIFLISAIRNSIDINVISTHSDVSTTTGEKVILFVVDRDLEDTLE